MGNWKTGQLKVEADAASDAAKAQADAAQSMAGLESDAKLIMSLYETYYPNFENIYGGSAVQGMQMEQIEQALAVLEKAEASVPQFAEQLGGLADKYGSTSMDIYNNMRAKGYTLEHGEERKMEQLLQGVEKVKLTRVASAETLVDYGSSLLGAFSGQLTDHRIKRMNEAKQLLLAGQKFDPGNAKLQEMLSGIDDQMAEVADKMEAMIDATEWKESVKDFTGPGDVKSLAAAAKKYFENDRDWGQKEDKEVEILKSASGGPGR